MKSFFAILAVPAFIASALAAPVKHTTVAQDALDIVQTLLSDVRHYTKAINETAASIIGPSDLSASANATLTNSIDSVLILIHDAIDESNSLVASISTPTSTSTSVSASGSVQASKRDLESDLDNLVNEIILEVSGSLSNVDDVDLQGLELNLQTLVVTAGFAISAAVSDIEADIRRIVSQASRTARDIERAIELANRQVGRTLDSVL